MEIYNMSLYASTMNLTPKQIALLNSSTTTSMQHNNSFTDDTKQTTKMHLAVFGHALSDEFSVALGIYFSLLSAIALISNTMLLYTIVSRKKLHCIGNVLMASLIISDILTAVLVAPQDAIFLLNGHHIGGKVSCGFKETLFFFSLPASVLNLFILTAERFVKIIFNFHHKRLFNKFTVSIAVTVLWIYTSLVAVFPILYKENSIFVHQGQCWIEFPYAYIYYHLSANFMVPIMLITIMNCVIFAVARRQAARIQNQLSLKSKIGQSHNILYTHFSNLVKNVKAAKTVALLVGVFLVCWLTFLIPAIQNILCNICHPREVTWTANAINYMTCALNPLLYGLLNKQIRKELPFRKFFAKYDGKFRQQTKVRLACRASQIPSRSPATSPTWL